MSKRYLRIVCKDWCFRYEILHNSIPQWEIGKKKHNMKPLVSCQFSGTCLEGQNFRENIGLFALLKLIHSYSPDIRLEFELRI
jgi:hypothetical protein